MATGTLANMTTFDQQFYGGFMDRVQTKLNVFNAESLGTMNLSALFHRGFYSEEAFFNNTMTIKDRDPASTATVTPDSIGSDSVKKVKVYKHITAAQSLQSFRTQGLSMDEIGFQMGTHAGDLILQEWRESAVSSLAGAFDIASLQPAQADEVVLDISADAGAGVFDVGTMISAMPLFGDATARLRAVVMHSHVYWPMVAAAAGNLATPTTADFAVQAGIPATLGLPIIVVDSPALIDAGAGPGGKDVYRTFILAEGAVGVQESEAPYTDTDKDLTKENAEMLFKTELAYSLGVKGISYTSGTDHPTNAELATAASWTKKYASKRDLPGIMVKSVATVNP